MAAGRLSSRALAVAVALSVSPGLGACGGEDESPASSAEGDEGSERFGEARVRGIEQAVEDGELPRVALEFIGPGGGVNPNFIDGPSFNDDVVRTRDDGGESGPKLRWDLDRNGTIDPDEREITEIELFAATAGRR